LPHLPPERRRSQAGMVPLSRAVTLSKDIVLISRILESTKCKRSTLNVYSRQSAPVTCCLLNQL
jgi:hypothetical protein